MFLLSYSLLGIIFYLKIHFTKLNYESNLRGNLSSAAYGIFHSFLRTSFYGIQGDF